MTALLFFVSGACGLIYQAVWAKQFSYLVGSTSLSAALVLAAFMGGLALGSAAAGAAMRRIRRPLRMYGWLELGVAAAAIGADAGLRGLSVWWLEVARGAAGWLVGLKLLLAAGLLLPATALMGATLPVLVEHRFRADPASRERMGVLYAVNAAGGVVGCLAAGFWLVELLGLSGTANVAQVLNAGVGLAALALARSEPAGGAAGGEAGDAGNPDIRYQISEGLVPLQALGAVTGFAAMLYEVAYTRVLVLVLGSSVHSFSLMLAGLLTGMALGGALAGRMLRRGRGATALLAAALAGMGVSVLVSLPLVQVVPRLYLPLYGLAHGSLAAHHALVLGLCGLLLLGPGICMGAYVPLLVDLADTDRARPGERAGRIYAATTAGNIAGALAAGLAVIPWLGVRRCFELGVVLNLAAALWLVRRGAPPAIAGVAGLGLLGLALAPSWNQEYLTTGFYRLRGSDAAAADRDRKMLYYREDDTGVVTVDDWGRGRLSLRVNGKADASNFGDFQNQKLLAHLPLLTHRDPQRVLVIGVGSGITAGAALCHPIQSLEAVEISPAVLEASRFFARDNGDFERDPRCRVVVADAREYVQLRPPDAPRYDVIVSEPTNYWISGMSNLVTVECLRALKANLAPDGILAQWMHGYDTDPEVFGILLRTVLAFPAQWDPKLGIHVT